MNYPKNEDLPIFVKWTEFLNWLFPVTAKFPKRVRFSFADRIDNHALDMVEDLVEARYTRNKLPILRRSNLRLEKMRVLLKLSHANRYLSYKAYEHAMRAINEVGRMLGGWIQNR